MASLYDELLANIGKTASVDNVKQGIQNFSSDELIRLAEDLATISKDKDLAEMAKLLPVYSANQRTDDQIETEQIIHGIDSSDAYTADADKDNMVLASYEEIKDKIKSKVSAKLEDDIEDVVEDAVDDAVDEAVDAATDEGVEVSASETLYALLKEGAAFEDMIETRAAEMAYEIIKQAEDYEVAREIVEEASEVLTDNPAKAHEYSEQMMEKVRTVAATNDIPMSDAAAAVTSKVIDTAEDNGLIEGDEGEDMEDIVGAIQAQAYEDAYNDLLKEAGVGTSLKSGYSTVKGVAGKGVGKVRDGAVFVKDKAAAGIGGARRFVVDHKGQLVPVAAGVGGVGLGAGGYALYDHLSEATPEEIYVAAYEEAYNDLLKEAGVGTAIKPGYSTVKGVAGKGVGKIKGAAVSGAGKIKGVAVSGSGKVRDGAVFVKDKAAAGIGGAKRFVVDHKGQLVPVAAGVGGVGLGAGGYALYDHLSEATPEEIYVAAYEEAYNDLLKEAGVGTAIKQGYSTVKGVAGRGVGKVRDGAVFVKDKAAAGIGGAKRFVVDHKGQLVPVAAGVGGVGLGAGGYALYDHLSEATPEEIYVAAYEEAYTGLQKKASTYNYFDGMSKYASELEYAYEKLAEEVMDAAEALVRQHGEQMGLNSSELYEYVRVSMDDIKTLAAKRDMNLAEAAQAYLTGDTGSEVGIVEETFPSPSEAPSVFKAPINSNQTQRPDEYIPQMAAPADPDVAAMIGEGEKEAYLQEYVKQLVKEAMYEIVEENY